MKEKILAKIAELQAENNRLFDVFNDGIENNHYEYDHLEHGGDFCAGGYDGDSLSHMLDILQEQNYILDKVANFIKQEA